MQRTPVTSSAVVSVGYDAARQVLELEFHSGRIYQYDGVPEGTYRWLLRSPSKGGFVARMINDRYPYRDVTAGPCDAQPDLEPALRASLDRLDT